MCFLEIFFIILQKEFLIPKSKLDTKKLIQQEQHILERSHVKIRNPHNGRHFLQGYFLDDLETILDLHGNKYQLDTDIQEVQSGVVRKVPSQVLIWLCLCHLLLLPPYVHLSS